MRLLIATFLFAFANTGTTAQNALRPRYIVDDVQKITNYLNFVNNNEHLDLAESVVRVSLKTKNAEIMTATLLLVAALVKKDRAHDLAEQAMKISQQFNDAAVRTALLIAREALKDFQAPIDEKK